MSKAWMPLYVSDYLGDTRRLKTLEHGAYLLLIMEYWQHGFLPEDDAELADITGLSVTEWLAIRPRISRLFYDGWRHKRIDAELAKADQISERRSSSAKRRWSKCNANAVELECTRARSTTTTTITDTPEIVDNHNLLPLSVEPEGAKPKKPRNDYPEDFQRFWSGYPTSPNMAKAVAFKEWRKLSDDERKSAINSLAAFREWCRKQPNYSPVYAERYLSQRRFDGFAKTAETVSAIPLVAVSQNSPEGQAWEQFTRATKGKGVPWTNGMWRFPTQFPPEARAAE